MNCRRIHITPNTIRAILVCAVVSSFGWQVIVPIFHDVFRQNKTSPVRDTVSNLKQVALAALMYAQEYDDRFPPSAHWRAALLPYCKNPTIFDSTLDESGTQSFQMNPNLAGKKAGNLRSVTNTVLFYEGTIRSPLFRYGGDENKRAILGFADGHVKTFKEDETQSLLWSASQQKTHNAR